MICVNDEHKMEINKTFIFSLHKISIKKKISVIKDTIDIIYEYTNFV